MRVRVDFNPDTVPAERAAVDLDLLPMRVHGVTVSLVSKDGGGGGHPVIDIEGPDDTVLGLLARGGYSDGEWETL